MSLGKSVDLLASELRNLPKAELHLHLRGMLGPELLLQLSTRHPPSQAITGAPEHHRRWFESYPAIAEFLHGKTPSLESIAPLFQPTNLKQFLTTYLLTGYFVKTEQDFDDLLTNAVTYLRTEGISYAEITVSIPEYLEQGFALETILDRLEGHQPPAGIQIFWIVDLVRNFGATRAERLVLDLIAYGCSRVVGITIGGDELRFPAGEFQAAYRYAHQAGLKCSVHAGEACGPASIWSALRDLKVDRIGHGIRAIEDPQLVEHLTAQRIPLEVCPTGNVRTGIVKRYREHPIRRLFDAGVPITVNTDDPAFFGGGLSLELARLTELSFVRTELHQLIQNGFSHAFRQTMGNLF